MNMIDIITTKKNKEALSEDQIRFFIQGVMDQTVPDYQISALLMAICINGMTAKETYALTLALARSGEQADVLSHFKRPMVDKHSTGGVGDKCTIIVGPIVSSLGVPFMKLSGRGLGFTGGTKDKLESVRGFRMDLDPDEMMSRIQSCGIAISGQSRKLAPADKRLYEIRDVTATTESIPLIAASIMSKKIASGAKRLLLDVKCGNGAFMKTFEDANALAGLLSDIAVQSDIDATIYITDMNQPLGNAIGNALEVKESCLTLSGKGPADLTELCVDFSAGILELAGVAPYSHCVELVRDSLQNQSSLNKFRQMIVSQGGTLHDDSSPVLDDQASFILDIPSHETGFIHTARAFELGLASMVLGAGREKYDDRIDYASGLIIHKKAGDQVLKDEPLATLYTNREDSLPKAEEMVRKAFSIGSEAIIRNPLILKTIKTGECLQKDSGVTL